jgi:DUF971 family protein
MVWNKDDLKLEVQMMKVTKSGNYRLNIILEDEEG